MRTLSSIDDYHFRVRAADTFYLKGQEGGKLRDAEEMEGLRLDLLAAARLGGCRGGE